MDVQASAVGSPPSSETLVRWFAALSNLQRTVAGSRDFFDDAARAVCDPGGLDVGIILRREEAAWVMVANTGSDSAAADDRLAQLFTEAADSGLVCWTTLNAGAGPPLCAVAAPIVTPGATVWGMVVGLRSIAAQSPERENRRRAVRPLEAWWLQLVAESLGNGVARLAMEETALQSRLLFQQAFAPQVVQELERNPAILTAREQEVTVLFCDLRDFSQVVDQLPPRVTYELLSEVLETLTCCVTEESGVIVDYYGDGLEAIWNAPIAQVDHAVRACRAAWHMQQRVAALAERWKYPLRAGCGINTGPAIIGNAGSRHRLKYGPRGLTVNVASRLESATKVVHCPILISQATAMHLDTDHLHYRVGRLQLKGCSTPIDAHEYCGPATAAEHASFEAWRCAYDRALHSCEAGELPQSLQQLQELPSLPLLRFGKGEFLMNTVQKRISHLPSRRQTDPRRDAPPAVFAIE